MKVGIVWFHRDLRLADHPALRAALQRVERIVALYIDDPEAEIGWPAGAAGRWWLARSLARLDGDLRSRGAGLTIRSGPSRDRLAEVIAETGATAVFWNRRIEPSLARRDERIRRELLAAGILVEVGPADLLFEPETIRSRSGEPYQVFTPFWRECLRGPDPAAPLPAPRRVAGLPRPPASSALPSGGDRNAGLQSEWDPGEEGARRRLRSFLDERAAAYARDRNRPDEEATARLSAHIHFGEISPREIWRRAGVRAGEGGERGIVAGIETWLRQIGWREFAHHLLIHFPRTTDRPLRPEFGSFPWRRSKRDLDAWRRGLTGVPIVDAGMRELRAIGWMHNRVRMVAASYLVKDLLIHWREGARWFWETLVDADLANNTLGWQWVAGSGADAAPYFRVFNPVVQGERYDPHGAYVRRWVPELAGVPARWIHRPWAAPRDALGSQGFLLGRTYPEPIVDHAAARDRALAAFGKVQNARRPGSARDEAP